MNCVSGNNAHYLCVNRFCELPNSFICADTTDLCKEDHESCSLISLTYVLKKSHFNPANTKHQTLVPLYDKAKSLTSLISNMLSSVALSKDIDRMLTSGKGLSSEDKQKISRFVGDKRLESNNDEGYKKIEKQLEEFQLLITQFQIKMKEKRNRQIQLLKKKLHQQEKYKPVQQQPESPKITKLPKMSKIQSASSAIRSSIKKEEKLASIEKYQEKNVQKSTGPIPVKSRLSAHEKISQKPKGIGFQQKISSILKNHVPKSPLFSRITNDIKTVNNLFNNKFDSAKLLYRASENEYLVSRFHDKCDGHKNTMTLILTQFDKIIGGFTPLPWKTGGGEWQEDENGKSFLFNLSSGQKYPIITRDKAIWCSRGYGPSFGHPDLQIADKALYNSNSCANFPNCYNNGNYKNSPGSTQLFCGTKNGHFRIKEWEVYEIILS